MQTALVCLLLLSFRAAVARTTYPVVDTNQRYCYDSYDESTTLGDENEYVHNEARDLAPVSTRNLFLDLSCPSFGQDASYGGLKQAFRSNGDGTVLDVNTGLIWTSDVYGEGLTYDQVENEVSRFSLGGYSDWRIPTIKELYTLSEFNGETGTNEETNVPYIDTNYFSIKYGSEQYTDGQLWSSNRYTGSISGHLKSDCNFAFNSISGRIECRELSSTKLHVRYVRGNEDIGKNTFSVNEKLSDIIVDTATGLEWTRSDSGIALDWNEALEYCNDLELGGFSDWKLPDAHELHSIVDYNRSPDGTKSPAIDSLFHSTEIENEAGSLDWGWYWTSTTHLDGSPPLGSKAVYIAFGRAMGNLGPSDGDTNGAVDVHGAGVQGSAPKVGAQSPNQVGRNGEYIRVYNVS